MAQWNNTGHSWAIDEIDEPRYMTGMKRWDHRNILWWILLERDERILDDRQELRILDYSILTYIPCN